MIQTPPLLCGIEHGQRDGTWITILCQPFTEVDLRNPERHWLLLPFGTYNNKLKVMIPENKIKALKEGYNLNT